MARFGFKISNVLSKATQVHEKFIRNSKELFKIFINSTTNEILKENGIAKMPKLANTLEMISENDFDVFYNGTLTNLMVREINENGKIIFLN